MKRILALEDSKEFQNLISLALSTKYSIDFAETCNEALSKLQAGDFSLMLIDIQLPDASGFTFVQKASQYNKDIPKIFLTADDNVGSVLMGFSLGADDYIKKPVTSLELLARVDAKVNKWLSQKNNGNRLVQGPIEFDLNSFKVFIHKEGEKHEVALTPIEFKLLLKMAQNPGRVFSRQLLIDQVWGANNYMEERGVDKHISSLRQKIKPLHNPIKTRSCLGYYFEDSSSAPAQVGGVQ